MMGSKAPFRGLVNSLYCIALLLFFPADPATATTYHVPGDYLTIQEAIDVYPRPI